MTLEQIKTSLKVIRALNMIYKATKSQHYKIRYLKSLWQLKKGIKEYKKNYDADRTIILKVG